MYDAIIGRFFSEDPIGIDPGDPNLYRYVKNDPVNLVDPSGLEPIEPADEPLPMANKETSSLVEEAIRALQSAALNFATRCINDERARNWYNAQTQAASAELLSQYQSGALTAKEAAERANEMRNVIMEATRNRTSDIGLAAAQARKRVGKTVPELVEKYSLKLFQVEFGKLTGPQQDKVYLEIVKSAGRPDDLTNKKVARYGRFGRGLIFLTFAISAYNIAVAEDPIRQTGKEAVVMGAGVGGAALGGMACAALIPEAPVVVVGLFVFLTGAVAAVLADELFDLALVQRAPKPRGGGPGGGVEATRGSWPPNTEFWAWRGGVIEVALIPNGPGEPPTAIVWYRDGTPPPSEKTIGLTFPSSNQFSRFELSGQRVPNGYVVSGNELLEIKFPEITFPE